MVQPVRKSVTVAWDRETAFRRFTSEMGEWWPLGTHSVGQENAVSVTFEGHVGGRIYERHTDGATSEWGRVTEWDPPSRVAFTWYPGRDPDGGQLVEVYFTPAEDGTRVDLVHSGWERLGERGQELRDGYDSGWEGVLQRFATNG
jgi:uncharacterized protein YndB with AHSA1/START domain